MYYSYVEIEYVATGFSPARMDLALKLLNLPSFIAEKRGNSSSTTSIPTAAPT
jgi:hypothetical protein